MEATSQHTQFKNHAAKFPKDNPILDTALAIPVVQIIAYEILLYRYQDNPLAHDHLNGLKNRVKQNISIFFGVSSVACLALAGLEGAGLEFPTWITPAILGIGGISLVHLIGRNFLHQGWNTCEVRGSLGSRNTYTRGNIQHTFQVT